MGMAPVVEVTMQNFDELFSVLEAGSSDDLQLANVLAMQVSDSPGDTCCCCSTAEPTVPAG